jgi:hypothetical protein
LLPGFPRYNQEVLRPRLQPAFSFAAFLLFCVMWASSCAAPLGPGFVVEKQEIRVQFASAAQTIHIEADYQLRNTGDRPIHEIDILLPTGRRLHTGAATTKWDGADITSGPRAGYPRNSVIRFATPWPVDAAHALHISYDILPPAPDRSDLSFTSDAFYLPAAGWSPELLQVRGFLGFGGGPPQKWELVINVPEGFLVHSSGTLKKSSRESKNGTQTFRALQTVKDRYPFVVAGRYGAKEIRDAHQKIILWSRASGRSGVLQQASAELARTIDVYNSIFGAPNSSVSTFWVVECPVPEGCISNFRSSAVALLNEDSREEPTAELGSSDTVMVDVSKGAPKLAAAAAPSLAASWLGYGRNPGFYQQTEPLSLLPVFAAARSREEIEGPQVRGEAIRHALRFVPKDAGTRQSQEPLRLQEPLGAPEPRGAQQPAATPAGGDVLGKDALGEGSESAANSITREARQIARAKSFLFFYALQDRYGLKVFNHAIDHMLYARAGRGFDLDDLIAAFEQETHQNVAAFVRLWMKHPGVPSDFRARYENSVSRSSGDALPPSSVLISKGAIP